MRLLAFETATRHISVALWQDGEVLERSAEMPNSGSELVLPWARALLAEAGITLGQLDAIAFGAGPGGFTGLRLACGVTQGLAYGLELPVVPVSTLAALALNAGDGVVWAVLDARMNEVYSAAYRVRGEAVHEIRAALCCPPGEIAVPPPSTEVVGGGRVHAAGDGFVTYPELLAGNVHVEMIANVWPTAAAVARLAAPRVERGETLAAADAQPIYVRDKVALTTAERLARGGVR